MKFKMLALLMVVCMLSACGKTEAVVDEPETEESVEAVEEIDYSPYEEVIKTATSFIKAGAEYDEKYDEMYSLMFFTPYELDYMGYTQMDLNDDGVDELIFGENNSEYEEFNGVVYNVYTLVDGEAVRVLNGWDRNRYYLCEDGIIVNEASNSAFDTIYGYYMIDGEELKLSEKVIYDGRENPDEPWFYATEDVLADQAEGLSEEKAREIIDSHVHKSIELTLFKDAPYEIQDLIDTVEVENDGYYGTIMTNLDEMPGADSTYGNVYSADILGNTLTLQASMKYEKNENLIYEGEFMNRGFYIFELTDDTEFYCSGGEAGSVPTAREEFEEYLQNFNGLALIIQVQDGVVVSMTLSS